jgi:hypothetical protein
MVEAKRKPGRRKVHRLHVMANIDDGGRVIAAIPVFQPLADGDTAYPVGLSVQRLHGPSHGGETGFVIRLVGADGNIATLVQRATGQPATVTHGLLRLAGDADVDADPAGLPPSDRLGQE